ncbi:MAG: hypothetical protein WB821_07750 [Burkholderiaceae bacterium]
MKKVLYGQKVATETPANGVTGLRCKTLDGKFFFRVRDERGEFVDYLLRHDDMKVTISQDELASFYAFGDSEGVLDHPSSVLGLQPIAS